MDTVTIDRSKLIEILEDMDGIENNVSGFFDGLWDILDDEEQVTAEETEITLSRCKKILSSILN